MIHEYRHRPGVPGRFLPSPPAAVDPDEAVELDAPIVDPAGPQGRPDDATGTEAASIIVTPAEEPVEEPRRKGGRGKANAADREV